MAKKLTATIQSAVISHIGCVRKNNEDNFFLDGDYMLPREIDAGAAIAYTSDAPCQMYAVSDGMGGLNGGERASCITVDRLAKFSRKVRQSQNIEGDFRDFTYAASEAVWQDAQASGSKKQGCTLCMLMVRDNIGYVANVGDSRAYILRMGELVQVSYDHTEVYRLFKQGALTREQARLHPKGNIINHYIGQPAEKRTGNFMYYRSLRLCNGDRFLLCSDGLTDLLTHEQIQHIMTTNSDPMESAQILVKTALELGGKDNTTCIVGDIIGQALSAPTKDDLTALNFSLEKTAEITSL